MVSTDATSAAMDALTDLGLEAFWLETATSEGVCSEGGIATTGDIRVLLAHHLLTVAEDLDQSLEETAEEAAEIAEENFYDINEP